MQNPDFFTAMRTARALSEPGEPNQEYIRGQVDLILDIYALDADAWRDAIRAEISKGGIFTGIGPE